MIKTENSSPNGLEEKSPKPPRQHVKRAAWIQQRYLDICVLCVSQLISIFAQMLCQKTETSRAEEFGVCSNFSCPAVSTWTWSSSPMLAWWVMLLGGNGLSQKIWNPVTSCCFYEKTLWDCHCKCRGQVLGSARALCSSARQSKRVGTRHFRIQVNLCKQEAGPGGLQKYRKANSQSIL
jgi:hypothetical protein